MAKAGTLEEAGVASFGPGPMLRAEGGDGRHLVALAAPINDHAELASHQCSFPEAILRGGFPPRWCGERWL